MRFLQALIILLSFLWTSFSIAQTATQATEKKSLEDLEKEYWKKKDLSPTVVQNRAFSKSGTFALAGSMGMMINDPVLQGTSSQFEALYFFSEEHGFSIGHESFTTGLNDSALQFQTEQGVSPNHNRPLSISSVSYNYFPIYGKLSLASKKIMYYDLGLSIGVSSLAFAQQTETGAIQKSALGAHLDIRQYFYLSQSFALTGSIRNIWTQQERIRNRAPHSSLGTVTFPNTQIHVGAAYFFK